MALELLFLVSFHISLWHQAEKKMTGERSQLSQFVPGSHLCADLVLQDYLTSVTHTWHCKRMEGEDKDGREDGRGDKGECQEKNNKIESDSVL